jgi:co-chaperonin GroES (HSP10)
MDLILLIPCGDRLLVKRDPPELRCGELIVPETSTLGVTTSGVIVRVGPHAHGFSEGDRVVFGILAGLSCAQMGVSSEEEYRLLPASDVQCTIASARDLMLAYGKKLAAKDWLLDKMTGVIHAAP